MYIFSTTAIIILSLTGFLIASYIHNKKKKKKKLICPMRSNCDTVIHSDYSRIMGIPVENLGIFYYASIFIAHIVVSFLTPNPIYKLIFFGISLCSVFFSAYLISIQAFIIKEWCTWCLCSAVVSLLICLFSYIQLSF